MDREQYEKDLKERQRQHLEKVYSRENSFWQPCMHDQCTSCFGTGIRTDGTSCIHGLSCPCPKCTPRC